MEPAPIGTQIDQLADELVRSRADYPDDLARREQLWLSREVLRARLQVKAEAEAVLQEVAPEFNPFGNRRP